MGLADFLAQAGRGTVVGNVAQAFGGQTTGQQMLNDQAKREHDFVNNQLPALLQEIHANTDESQIRPLGTKFMLTALQAGIPLKGAENLMEKMIGPALNGVRQEGLNKLADQYKAQPAQPAQFTAGDKFAAAPLTAPPSGPAPITPSGNFADAKPEKPLDLNFMMKFGQLTGANPEQFNKMLETPATMAGKDLSNKKTQQAIDQENQAQEAIKGLPNIPGPEGQPSQQAVATISRPGITQFVDQRAKQEDPLLEERRNLLNAQATRDSALASRALQGPANGGVSPYQQFNEAARMRTEFLAQSKNFQQVRDGYNRLKTSLSAGTPAGDFLGIYNFMKGIADPGGRVTEQDFRDASKARPWLEAHGLSWDAVSSIWSGKRMTPGMRADFLARGKAAYDAEAQQHQQRVNETTRMAKTFGINPDVVVSDITATGAAPEAPGGQGGYSGGAPSGSGSGAAGQGQQLDAQGAAAILKEAGGDKNKAREIAKQRGYRF